ncbi:MAG: GNAT family N-acetyltransferase [Archangium sp.]
MKLLRATAAQQIARDDASFPAWGTGLTLASFKERERRLRAHAWAKRTMASWFWVDGAGQVLSSCETFIDTAHAGSRAGLAATIASVFTEERHRGRGHAEAMLRALVEELRKTCLAVTLFSEIGTKLYARLGFCAVPAYDTWFEPLAEAPSVDWLKAPLPDVIRPTPPPDTLKLDLSSERLDWQLVREDVYGTRLDVHGARDGDACITWTAYWKTKELQVLSLDAPSPRLIAAARHVAHRAGLPKVRVWETMDMSTIPGARREARTDEIAMFLPLTPGIQAWTQVERGLWA